MLPEREREGESERVESNENIHDTGRFEEGTFVNKPTILCNVQEFAEDSRR